MRHVLSLLLVLTACSAAPADPTTLFKDWRLAVQKHKSVRFDVAITVEGKDPRKKTYVGVQHVSGFDGTTQEDVTAHGQVRLVVEEDEGRVVRVEQTTPSVDGSRRTSSPCTASGAQRRTCCGLLLRSSRNRQRSSLRSGHDC